MSKVQELQSIFLPKKTQEFTGQVKNTENVRRPEIQTEKNKTAKLSAEKYRICVKAALTITSYQN